MCRTGCTAEFFEDLTFALWTRQICARLRLTPKTFPVRPWAAATPVGARALRRSPAQLGEPSPRGARSPPGAVPGGRGRPSLRRAPIAAPPAAPGTRGPTGVTALARGREEAGGSDRRRAVPGGPGRTSPRLKAARAEEEPHARQPPPASRPRSATPGLLGRGHSTASPSRKASGRAGPTGRSSERHGRGAEQLLPACRGWSRAAPWGSADISRRVAAPHSSSAEDGSLGRRWWTPCRPAAARRMTATFGRWAAGGAPGLRWAPELPAPSRVSAARTARSEAVPLSPGRARAHLHTRSPVPPGGSSAFLSCSCLSPAPRSLSSNRRVYLSEAYSSEAAKLTDSLGSL